MTVPSPLGSRIYAAASHRAQDGVELRPRYVDASNDKQLLRRYLNNVRIWCIPAACCIGKIGVPDVNHQMPRLESAPITLFLFLKVVGHTLRQSTAEAPGLVGSICLRTICSRKRDTK